MGNFEKLVVLAVLFLTAIVLAVSLRDDGVEAGSPDALGGGEAGSPVAGEGAVAPVVVAAVDPGRGAVPEPGVHEPGPPVPRGATASRGAIEPPAENGARSGLLLDSTVRDDARGASAPTGGPSPAASGGPKRILVHETGLRPAALEQYMIYTVRAGDTWAGLAQRFYRNTAYVEELRTANEEMVRPLAGEDVFVPVFDFAQEAGQRAPLRPREVMAPPAAPVERQGAVAPAAASSYEVAPGDNLSKISAKVYGTPHRWKEIYDANRDVLDSPDWVQVGMKLRIPR